MATRKKAIRAYEIRKAKRGNNPCYSVWINGERRTVGFQREVTALVELWKFVQSDLEHELLTVPDVWRKA